MQEVQVQSMLYRSINEIKILSPITFGTAEGACTLSGPFGHHDPGLGRIDWMECDNLQHLPSSADSRAEIPVIRNM